MGGMRGKTAPGSVIRPNCFFLPDDFFPLPAIREKQNLYNAFCNDYNAVYQTVVSIRNHKGNAFGEDGERR